MPSGKLQTYTAVPQKEVFETPPQDVRERLEAKGYTLDDFLRGERSERGEMLSIHKGHPVPRKGLPYPEALSVNNTVKRVTLTLFGSFSGLRKGFTGFLEEYLSNYCQLCDSIYGTCYRIPYLKKEWYISTGRGVWDLTSVFLIKIGITKETSNHVGKIMATILEYDDAYRMPVVDIMSEFTKEEIIQSPSKFVKKAVRLFVERSDNDLFKKKFKKIASILSFILWIPRFRRAFKKAFKEVDLSLLRYDEYDQYWSLGRKGYDARGETYEERQTEWRGRIKEFIKDDAV